VYPSGTSRANTNVHTSILHIIILQPRQANSQIHHYPVVVVDFAKRQRQNKGIWIKTLALTHTYKDQDLVCLACHGSHLYQKSKQLYSRRVTFTSWLYHMPTASLIRQLLMWSGGSGHLVQNELCQRNVIIMQSQHHSCSRKPLWLVLAQV